MTFQRMMLCWRSLVTENARNGYGGFKPTVMYEHLREWMASSDLTTIMTYVNQGLSGEMSVYREKSVPRRADDRKH